MSPGPEGTSSPIIVHQGLLKYANNPFGRYAASLESEYRQAELSMLALTGTRPICCTAQVGGGHGCHVHSDHGLVR